LIIWGIIGSATRNKRQQGTLLTADISHFQTMTHTDAVRILTRKGKRLFDAPKQFVRFTNDEKADDLLNDLEKFPHAYVLACAMDRQIRAERAWIIPYRFSEKLGGFQFSMLQALSQQKIHNLMTKPEPLHRFVDEMTLNFHEAINLIAK